MTESIKQPTASDLSESAGSSSAITIRDTFAMAGSVPWLRLLYNRELKARHFKIGTPYVEWLEERLGSILHEQEMLFKHTRCPKNNNFVKKQWEAGEHIFQITIDR